MRSLVATIAAVVGIISLLTLALVPGAARLGLLSPLGAFTIFGGTLFFGMLLSLILGVIALVRTRARTGLAGRQRAWLGTLAGLGMLGLIATFALVLPRSSIHDVTTNIADPPEFSDAVRTLADRRNGIDYPDGPDTVPASQRELFPDLSTIAVEAPPGETLERSRRVAESLGWTVTAVDEAGGIVEAYDTTAVFRFVDDVVIRVRPGSAGGSSVDVRSNSRVGGGDAGANANRIRAFRDELLSAP